MLPPSIRLESLDDDARDSIARAGLKLQRAGFLSPAVHFAEAAGEILSNDSFVDTMARLNRAGIAFAEDYKLGWAPADIMRELQARGRVKDAFTAIAWRGPDDWFTAIHGRDQNYGRRFLDSFSVLLLDMNGTFMFGHDRFGPNEDYYATYQSLGGNRLDRESLTRIMQSSCEALMRIYDSPGRCDDFPTLAEVFRSYGQAGAEDVPVLERVFAAHEIGQVPPAHRDFLQRMATTHALGVVSNICAQPSLWLNSPETAEVFALFQARVFSSEGRSIKPSPMLFRRALAAFPADARVLFVGDSLERDIIPAKQLGMSTAWIAPQGVHPAADRVVASLVDLD